jgi:hypothetical protein
LYCDPLDRPIPEGAALAVIKPNPPEDQPGNEFRGTITLSERAESGDTELVGDLSADFNTPMKVLYPSIESSQSVFPIQRFVDNPRTYPRFEIVFPFEDPSGDPLEGEITYEAGGIRLITEENTQSGTNYSGDSVYLDDVEFALTRGGQDITQTVVEASVTELGEEESQTARTFSGPTNQNLARLRADGFEPTDWGIGTGGGSLSLAELKARERLRYWRNHNEMFSVTGVDRDGTTQLTGDELVTLDGQTYTVHSIKYDAAKGETELTLIEYEDRGTSGITLETVLEQSDGAAGSTSGGGGTAPAVGGGGGGASTWDALSDKPLVLTPPGFSAGNFPSAEQLASADIASALSHGPSLADGIRSQSEGIRSGGSETDTALVTEAAIRDAFSNFDGGASTLDELTDTSLTTDPYQSDRVLKGTGSGDYVDVTVSAMLGEGKLGDLGGVGVSGLSDGQVLSRNGSSWTNETISNLLSDHATVADHSDVSAFRTAVREVENASDTAIVSEEGVREGLDSVAAEIPDVLSDLNDVSSAVQADGNILASSGGDWREEDASSIASDHIEIRDHKGVGVSGLADGQVLSRTGGGSWTNETLSSLLSDHASWSDIGNVSVSSAEDNHVAYYDAPNSTWKPISVSDLVSDKGTLRVGTVGQASDGQSVTKSRKPTASDGQGKVDGFIWVYVADTDSDGIEEAESYVWDKSEGQWDQLQTGIAGGIIETRSIFSKQIRADSITSENARIDTAKIDDLTSELIKVTNENSDGVKIEPSGIDTPSLAADDGFIGNLESNIFQTGTALVEGTLQIGDDTPHLLIRGDNQVIESSNYASGVEGVRVSPELIEAERGRYRGELESTVVRKNVVEARGAESVHAPTTDLAREVEPVFKIESVDMSGDGITITYSLNEDHLFVRDGIAQPPNTVRIKEGTDALIAGVTERTDTSSGTFLHLDESVLTDWREGTPVTRWDQHIRDSALGPLGSFTSYVSGGTEQVRIGNLGGTAGNEGFGVVIGPQQSLVYSTETSELTVRGRGDFTSVQAGPITITQSGISGRQFNQNTSEGRLDYFPSATGTEVLSDVNMPGNAWTIPNEINGDPNPIKTESFGYQGGGEDYQVCSDYNYETQECESYRTETQYTGVGYQEVDLAAFAGQVVTVTVEAALNKVEGGGFGPPPSGASVEIKPNEEPTITSFTIPDTDGSVQTFEFTFEVPTGIPATTRVRFYLTRAKAEIHSISLEGRPRRASYGFSGIELFDDSDNKTLEADRTNGALAQRSLSSAPPPPDAGMGMIYWQNGEPRVQDDASNIYAINLTQLN